MIVYAIFSVYPIYRQFDISFYNWHIFPGASNPSVGFSNYAQIFHDPVIRTAALNTLLFLVITVPIQMALGLFSAAMLTDRLARLSRVASGRLYPGCHVMGRCELRLRLHLQRVARGPDELVAES